MGSEIDADTIPAAAGVVEQSVDFTKGCYTGQELVARIDSRGNKTPTRLVRLSGEGAAPDTGTALMLEDKERATVTTTVVADSDDAWVGLGYLHRSVETPALLSQPDGPPVQVASVS